MSSEHPTYPNPTIAEAVCNIHFRLSQAKEWLSFPGKLFKHIQNDYPEMEPLVEIGLQFEQGPLGAGTNLVPKRQKVRFKHSTRPLILQLGEDFLSISTLPPYRGWKVMRRDALAAWQQVEEVLQPEVINRIGIRYINRIEKETEQDHLGTWLVANDYIPNGILRSEPGSLLRLQTRLDTENSLIITLGDTQSEVNGEGVIIFDIDRIFEREMATGQEFLEQEIDRLHAEAWEVFSSAKGEQLEAFLNMNGEHQIYPENESNQNVVLSPEMQEFLQVLRSWCETDDQERIDTWEYLKQALDEDRLSDRKLFS
ncbi:MAG TPA: TIGR04255 family protein [Ktedonobacteraceae bacterium]|nr:TIGR04255 family protein [Ktedonobacteraceae bacterium]